MKKKRLLIIFSILFLIVACFGIFYNIESESYNDEDSSSSTIQIKEEDTLSMMLETAYESGEYKMTTQSNWPTEGYVFNPTLSKCENGGELTWDDEKKLVSMSGNMSDKCYVYFDKLKDPTLAEYVVSLYSVGNESTTDLYYHNGQYKNSDGTTVLDAQDYSYRYAGASDKVNNYVCFGSDDETCPEDNLYRIIGVFGEQVKLIKATVATSSLLGTDGAYRNDKYFWSTLSKCPASTTGYLNNSLNKAMFLSNNKNILAGPFSSSGCNMWEYSDLNTTNLNTNYLNSIGSVWGSKIATTSWNVGGNTEANISYVEPSVAYQNEVGSLSSSTLYEAKIGLMYVSDYEFAASSTAWTLVGYNSSDSTADYRTATDINWLFLGLEEWTITPLNDSTVSSFALDSSGYITIDITTFYFSYKIKYVRPTFYLNSDVIYVSGSGSSSDPIRVS